MKVKLNNRGFAISTLIYSIFLLFLVFVSSLLALLAYRKNIFDAHKNAIYEETKRIPYVIVPNVDDLDYNDRINFKLTDNISGCLSNKCYIESIFLDDVEIEKDEWDTYLRGLTPGEYKFVYKISNGETGLNEERITKIRKITIK